MGSPNLHDMYVPPTMHLLRPEPMHYTYCGLGWTVRIPTADDNVSYYELGGPHVRVIKATDRSARVTCERCKKSMLQA